MLNLDLYGSPICPFGLYSGLLGAYRRKIIWFILNFGPQGYTSDMAASFGAKLVSLLVPLLAPVGLGFWQIVVALVAGISAKEVMVSSFIVLFGIQGMKTAGEMAALNGTRSA